MTTTMLETVEINNEAFFKISDTDAMRPFFMSIVSNSDHWMFVSSNGGISAGRKNPDNAFFPYYTDDKITEHAENTGSKTIFQISKGGTTYLWEPFSNRGEGRYDITRNIYQNKWTNKVLFEEINLDLHLTFQYEWNSSNLFGFVKQSRLFNNSTETIDVKLVDGFQNIIPAGVPCDLQTKTSNLADAYKRSELLPALGIGIFALSAIIVDKAEPAEALKANIAWSVGLDNAVYLLSPNQLKAFRQNQNIYQEEDIKGEKGSYLVVSNLSLEAGVQKHWMVIGNLNQNHSALAALSNQISTDNDLKHKILADIEAGTHQLKQLTGAADSFQYTADKLNDTRHFSNVLFNIMRGGIFDNNYQIHKKDFLQYLQKANKIVYQTVQPELSNLADEFSLFGLKNIAAASLNPDFIRLATEYLPLKFSRRHGDPSRPWNQFSINIKNENDGSEILDYQGNWRDLFQNWEALAYSYPSFIEGMISKFLNATTFEGYNPYRVTKDGFDWETIEPDNPWSYIGYWGDHQIIYLLKFLEFSEQLDAGSISKMLAKRNFVYANVPYKIKAYQDIVKHPKDTIEFDHLNEKNIHVRIQAMGADGALLQNLSGEIYRVNFLEKILATLLSKLSNFIPEAGIWMNTQRPEWNDANNALVGNGVSMVTLCYLRRFLKFLQPVLANIAKQNIPISKELYTLFNDLSNIFSNNLTLLSAPISDKDRKIITDALGEAGSAYRIQIYEHGFSAEMKEVSGAELISLVNHSIQFAEHTIRANKRKDGLYHAYNLLSFDGEAVRIAYLSEMLEGQVAVLSSGLLSPKENAEVLEALKNSALYRAEQNSYILYPNKSLLKFSERNTIPNTAVQNSELLKKLLNDNSTAILEKDINGQYHFNGNFKNAGDLLIGLNRLSAKYQLLVAKEKSIVLQIFEDVFNHKEFTGRSGTFYGYEGLGSIYWHMVSKLGVAAMEVCLQAIQDNADGEIVSKLIAQYYDVKAGIGVHKSPQVFGAFPITPYSHTPFNKGAQQPGMTGQVKEDILCRIGELGIKLKDGYLKFEPRLLFAAEFLTPKSTATFVLSDGSIKEISMPENSLAFSICQLPVIYTKSQQNKIEVHHSNGAIESFEGNTLNADISTKIFQRTGEIITLIVHINTDILR